jgi:hypothetical protein
MRPRNLIRYFTVLIVLLVSQTAISSAQDDSVEARLLNADEGQILVNTASEHRGESERKPDCSHLVHQIYEASGFPYPYASSYDLYAGIGNFRHVFTPRPGDLVVWRGHVGILIDPVEKTFYSSVTSGLRTEYYDGPYWRTLGRPRFYRYVLSGTHEFSTTNAPAPVGDSLSQPQALAPPVRKEIAEKSLLENNLPAKTDSPVLSPNTASSLKRTKALPANIIVVAAASRPTNEEIGNTILEYNTSAGNLLQNWPAANLGRIVMVYDQLRVARVDLKRDRGWVSAQAEGRFSIGGKGFEGKHRIEKLRCELRRTPQGWQLQMPANRIYVPRDAAIRALATQLASLTQHEVDSEDSSSSLNQQKMIVRALSSLFDSK